MEMLAMLMASFWSIWHGYVKFIVLAVMAVIVYFYLRNPFERKKLDSLIKKIALD